MGRLTIQDLAAVLVERNSLSAKEAQQFVAAIFDVIQEGVEKDRLVKVKGLGTFKVIDVEARESVNVNTGERVVIEGHPKVSFTPDVTMKELVNKPFSGFETVILNDGVDFDDMSSLNLDADTEAESDVEDVPMPPVQEEEPVQEEPAPVVVVEEEPAQVEEEPAPVVEEEPAPVVEEESAPIVEDEPAPVVEEEPAPVVAERQATAEDVEEEPAPVEKNTALVEKKKSPSQSTKWLLLAVLSCLFYFAAGYYLGSLRARADSDADKTVEQLQPKAPLDSLAAVSKDTLPKDTFASQTVAAVPPASQIVAADTVVKTVKPATIDVQKQKEAARQTAAEAFSKKYENMDGRVRTGAYRIVGTDFVVKVRQGETLYRITRRTLGAGMECYIEVYNGFTSTTKLKPGQEVKIPKLQVKKKKK